MDIYILRHGKAEERSSLVKSDFKRRLTESGRKELCCISRAIKNLNLGLDFVISSPLLRAKQTAEILLSHVKSKRRSVVIWDELKPESDTGSILSKLSVLKPDSSVLLVGHEPLLTDLIGSMISTSAVSISLKKSGFAHVQGYSRDSVVNGTLRSIMTPRQLKKLCK